jgi:hypothetical protein
MVWVQECYIMYVDILGAFVFMLAPEQIKVEKSNKVVVHIVPSLPYFNIFVPQRPAIELNRGYLYEP